MITPKNITLRCDECKCVGKSFFDKQWNPSSKMGITSVVDEAMVNFGP